jgi:hypothetical protein
LKRFSCPAAYCNIAFIGKEGNNYEENDSLDFDQSLLQRDLSGLALGFGIDVKTNIFGTTIGFRALGSSMSYNEKVNTVYFNGDKFDGAYTSTFLILFYQFGTP